jgi:hypothetical protein
MGHKALKLHVQGEGNHLNIGFELASLSLQAHPTMLGGQFSLSGYAADEPMETGAPGTLPYSSVVALRG